MIRAGFETTDPRTQTRTVLVKAAAETGGRGWVLEVHCPQGAPPASPAHLHKTWVETFEMLEGTAAYLLGGEQRTLRKGETVLMPAGVTHTHPWNTGAGEMVYRQTNDFGATTPDAVTDLMGALATLNGLAREGRLNSRGLPRNPFQFIATGLVYTKHGCTTPRSRFRSRRGSLQHSDDSWKRLDTGASTIGMCASTAKDSGQPDMDDIQLVERMRSGDERAFDEFFGAYCPRLFRFAVRRRGRQAGILRGLP